MKKIYIVLIMLSIFLAGCVNAEVQQSVDVEALIQDNDKMEVHYINVGQADCIYIKRGDTDILIDAGNNKDGPHVVNYLKKEHVDDIELLISSHPHSDHIGGLDDVLDAFDVEKIIKSGKDSTSKTYKSYIASVENEKSEGAEVFDDYNVTFDFSGLKFSIIDPGDTWEDTNDYSVICKAEFGESSFLFTGDAETPVEKKLLKHPEIRNIDVLKVGHHGSKSSSSEDFLDVVKPEIAVISCGKDNKYKHPHKITLSKLKERGVEIYRTDIDNTIVLSTNGTQITRESD